MFRTKKKADIAWQPRGDQLLVRPLITAERTAGGLFIPDANRERPQKGVVLAVGPGLASELTGKAIPLQSQVGDLVTFGKFAGVTFELDDEDVLIMRDQEAIAAKPVDSYTLVEHVDARGKTHAHEEGLICEHCPRPNLEAERERLRQARASQLVGEDNLPMEAERGEPLVKL